MSIEKYALLDVLGPISGIVPDRRAAIYFDNQPIGSRYSGQWYDKNGKPFYFEAKVNKVVDTRPDTTQMKSLYSPTGEPAGAGANWMSFYYDGAKANLDDDYPSDATTPGVVFPNDSVTGSIESEGDEDWFKVFLDSAYTYEFKAEGVLQNPIITLYDTVAIKTSKDGSLVYRPVASGTYYSGIKDASSSTGSYSLKLNRDDYASSVDTLGNLSSGGQATGKIEWSSDEDWFKVTMVYGHSYLVEARGLDSSSGTLPDPYLEVLNNASLVAASADGDLRNISTHDAAVTYSPKLSGTYFVNVKDFAGLGTGTYTVKVTDLTQSNSSAKNFYTTTKGDDNLNGGAGIDTTIFNNSRSAYTFTKTGSGWAVSGTGEGTDSLFDIERLQFADKKIALDINAEGNAGKAILFIGTLAYSGINNASLIGTVLSYIDQGTSIRDLFQLVVDAGVVSQLAGSDSNVDLAKLVYRNVIGTEPTPDAANMLASYLQGSGGTLSKADFLSAIAGLELNQSHVNLVGLAQTGVEYI